VNAEPLCYDKHDRDYAHFLWEIHPSDCAWVINNLFPEVELGEQLGHGSYGVVFADGRDSTLCHKFTFVSPQEVGPTRKWLSRLLLEDPPWYAGVRDFGFRLCRTRRFYLLKISMNRMKALNVSTLQVIKWIQTLQDIYGLYYTDSGTHNVMQDSEGNLKVIDGDYTMEW
jgi:hypothetical protein